MWGAVSTLRRWLLGRSEAKPVAPPREPGLVTGIAAPECDGQRLARLASWCGDGRAAAAEIELADWRRQPHCPPAAATLLALLAWRRGRTDQALTSMQSYLRRHGDGDAAFMQTLASLHAFNGEADEADRLLTQARDDFAQDERFCDWLALIDAPARQRPKPSIGAVEALAIELQAAGGVIPSLVAAQKVRPHRPTIALLRAALVRVERDVDDDRARLTICHAAAELALLAGEPDEARRWAHRGLRIDPYHAPLALLLGGLDDDEAIGPPAASVLMSALSRHPRFADLRAALIRREFAQGRTVAARRRLRNWLRREPNEPAAVGLEQELAA